MKKNRKIIEYITESNKKMLNEGNTSKATTVENAIVYNWNKMVVGLKGKELATASGITSTQYNALPAEVKKAGMGIVKNTYKSQTLAVNNTPAEHLGRGTAALTPFWQSFGASDTTPKTDFIIGGTDMVSLKIGPSQLMSGGASESRATFNAAISNMRATPAQQELIQQIEMKLGDFIERGLTKSGTVKTHLNAGDDQIINAGEKAHKEMMQLMGEFFTKSKKFRTEFAREAMTGNAKFGQASTASANKILVGTFDGTANVHLLTEDEYAARVADKMSLSVRFKSASQKLKKQKTGRYHFWSVISLGVKEGIEDFNSLHKKGQLLTESEQQSFWTRIVGRIKQSLITAWNWAKQSLNNVIQFFGVMVADQIPQVDVENFEFPM